MDNRYRLRMVDASIKDFKSACMALRFHSHYDKLLLRNGITSAKLILCTKLASNNGSAFNLTTSKYRFQHYSFHSSSHLLHDPVSV